MIKFNVLCSHFVKEVPHSITLQHDQLLMFFELFSFNVSFLLSSPQIGGSQGLSEGKFVQARKKARRRRKIFVALLTLPHVTFRLKATYGACSEEEIGPIYNPLAWPLPPSPSSHLSPLPEVSVFYGNTFVRKS